MDTFPTDPTATGSTSTDSRDSHNLLAVALEAYACHLSVVPPRQDGSKAPIESWKDYQREPADEAKIREWYGNGATGIGIVCGRVSGNLECLDFDCPDTFQAFVELARQADLGELIDHLETQYHEVSPSGGHHLPYRCEVIEGNQKLARRLKRPGEKTHDRDRIKVLIETRGEGGYLITAPSNGPVHPSGRPYVLLSGGFATLPRITPAEREELLRLARTFDQTEPLRPIAAVPSSTPTSPTRADRDGVDGRPGDDFNARMTWEALLEPWGWKRVFSRGGVTFWRRPGKTQGISATTGYAGTDFFYPFTSSTEFDPNRAYSKFAVFAITSHSGDFQAAARALGQAGYGSQAKNRSRLKSVASGGKFRHETEAAEAAEANATPKLESEPKNLIPLQSKPTPTPTPTPIPKSSPTLMVGKKGVLLCNVTNALRLIQGSDAFDQAIGFDEFSGRMMVLKALPWDREFVKPREWMDADDTALNSWFQDEGGLTVLSLTITAQAIRAVIQKRRFHPVRDWLNALVWDGAQRLDRLMIDYFGAQDTTYHRHVGSKFVIGAIARIYRPGCKHDCMPVLYGKQGALKSTGVRFLFGDEWFTDSLPDLRNKDSMIQLTGKWVVEMAELDAMVRVESSRVKAFLSTLVDRYRPAYGRNAADYPRQCVFVGTVNDIEFLKDSTGNRRFWPVKVGNIDLAAILRDREQLLAEAVARYHNQETWWLDDQEVIDQAAQHQDDSYQHDEREELILRYTRQKQVPAVGENGEPITDRYGNVEMMWVDRDKPLEDVSVSEIMDMIGIPLNRRNRGDQMQIADCLKALDFVKFKVKRNGIVVGRYRRRDG